MKKLISAHSHLLTKPQELDFFADRISQIWLLELPNEKEIPGYTRPSTEDEILAVAKQFPGLYLPFKWVDFRKGPDQIDRAVEKGFIGFKGICPQKSYDDESYLPVYERIAKYHCPMVFHTGYVSTPAYSKRCPDFCYQAGNMRPASLYTLARLFPEITFVAAHFGVPWERELFDLEIRLLPNFYIDLSGGHSEDILNIVAEHAHHEALLPGGEKGLFADKFLLGLDAYLGHPQLHQDVYAYCNEFVAGLEKKAAGTVWEKSVPGILAGNAERVMKENHLL